FTAYKPTITSFNPGSAKIGDTITIVGLNFVEVSSVKIGDVACDFIVNDERTIFLTVSSQARSDFILISAIQGDAKSTTRLRIKNNTPKIRSIFPQIVLPGSTVSIEGDDFY